MRIESEGDLECVVSKLKAKLQRARMDGKAVCLKIQVRRQKTTKANKVTFLPADAAL